MKKKFFIIMFLFSATFGVLAQSLDNGYYQVCFSDSLNNSYVLKISGNNFVKYYSAKDSISGSLTFIGESSLIFKSDNTDNTRYIKAEGPLKEIYKSWGLPIVVEIEKKRNSSKIIYFRTTFEKNYHITVNTGFFKKMPKRYIFNSKDIVCSSCKKLGKKLKDEESNKN